MHSVLTPTHISDLHISTSLPHTSVLLVKLKRTNEGTTDHMQQAKAPAPWLTATATAMISSTDDVRRTVQAKPVVVVGRRECCMAHVARCLLLGQGANPAVLEVSDDADPAALVFALWPKDNSTKVATEVAFPVVFIGGRLLGGLDSLMAMHMAGELVPVLKQAGALWL
ncbi:hypothetical protein VPH35_051244 [Triticum aestivum]